MFYAERRYLDMHFPHHHSLNLEDKEIRSFCFLGFFFSIAITAFNLILPLILNDLLGGNKVLVGYYLSGFAFVEIFSSLLVSYVFMKYSKVSVLIHSLMWCIAAILGMGVVSSIYPFAILDILRSVLFIVILTAFILLISDFSTKEKLAKNMSVRTVLNNAGGVLGSFLIGGIVAYYGNGSMFSFVALILLLLLFYLSHMKLVQKNKTLHHNKDKFSMKDILKTFGDLKRREDIRQIFLLYFHFGLWISFYSGFKSLMIVDLGYDVERLGIIAALTSISAGFSSVYSSRMHKFLDIKNKSIFTSFILSSLSILMFFLYELGLMGYALPFVIILISSYFFLQFVASARLIFFSFVLNVKDRAKYSSFAIIVFSIAKLITPFLVSIGLKMGFGMHHFFLVMPFVSFLMNYIFYRRPELEGK
jgi:MFS family permease